MAMRVPINLATEPFRRDRAVLVGSAAIAAVLVVLLAFQIFTIVAGRQQAADIRVAIDHESAQLRSLAVQQGRLNATMRRPENAEVLEHSLFLNTLIDRKAISWTRIFEDLEKVMPYDVRLVSVRLPQVNSNNQVLLDMVVGAKDVQPILELLKHLEGAPQFGPYTVQTSTPPSQTDPLYRYHVTVNYAQKL
jgi:type IV pilus assembly protein PilN